MKNKTILLTFTLFVIVVFTGCTSGNNEGDSNAPAIDTPGNKELSDSQIIEKYIATIGEPDYDITKILGDGKITYIGGTNGTNSTDAVQSRRYNTNLFGESLSMITSLEAGYVTDMSITPESGTYDDWLKKITGSLGNPDETIEAYKNQNEEVRASAWNLDDGSLTLQSACGTVLLRVNGRIKK